MRALSGTIIDFELSTVLSGDLSALCAYFDKTALATIPQICERGAERNVRAQAHSLRWRIMR
jgi:hypothetical protein